MMERESGRSKVSGGAAREYHSRRQSAGHDKVGRSSPAKPVKRQSGNELRWKTGVIVKLLDCIQDATLWANQEEQQQFILNLYEYLILCIAIDNRDIRQRISKLFGGCIKVMLLKQYPIKAVKQLPTINGEDDDDDDESGDSVQNGGDQHDDVEEDQDTDKLHLDS